MPTISQVGTQTSPISLNQVEIGRGDKGANVSALQQALNQAGFQLEVDGDFGPKTEQAVRDFQKQNGLQVDGIVGPKTTAALTGSAAKANAATYASPQALKHLDLNKELTSADSRLSVAIGVAEGTRTPDGGHTAAYKGHQDPKSGWNVGTFSYQHKASSPRQADAKQLAEFKRLQPAYEEACRKAGLDSTDPVLAGSVFDLYNQAPKAVTGKGGLLDQLPALAKKGVTADNLAEARYKSFYDPDQRKFDTTFTLSELKADQQRRTDALVSVLGQSDAPAAMSSAPPSSSAWGEGSGSGTSAPAAGRRKSSSAMSSAPPAGSGSGSGGGPGVPEKIGLNSKGPEVTKLKQALKDAGFYHGPVNDRMGNQGVEALKRAKNALGIPGPENLAGPETIARITEHAKGVPNLHVEVDFVSQYNSAVDGDYPTQSADEKCDNACEFMMKNTSNHGSRATATRGNANVIEFGGGGPRESGFQYIESQLRSGKPVMIGVSRPKGGHDPSNINGINHYLVATGMGTDDKGRQYITFNDPAHSSAAGGKDTNPKNRLYLNGGEFQQNEGGDPYKLRGVVRNL